MEPFHGWDVLEDNTSFGGYNLDRISDLLRQSETLTDSERQLLLKLIWLYPQVPESAQANASKRIEPFLSRFESQWDPFMREVQTLVLDLEVALASRNK